MIGRTPEYLGKAITPSEAKLLALYALVTPFVVLTLSSWAISTDMGRAGLVANTGPHALSEVVFAYASNMANNGITMAGLNANSVFYNMTTVLAMLAGRFGLVALALALAGRFAAQGRRPISIGSLPSDTVTFGVLVLGTIVLVGALSFLPALVPGPLVEFLQR
jgi:K+-transporting ATPase ATPase A chain